MAGLNSPPSDHDSEDYDVKLVFKPLQETGCDRVVLDGVQEFIVKGTLRGYPCSINEAVNSNEGKSDVRLYICMHVYVCSNVYVLVCMCVDVRLFTCCCVYSSNCRVVHYYGAHYAQYAPSLNNIIYKNVVRLSYDLRRGPSQ